MPTILEQLQELGTGFRELWKELKRVEWKSLLVEWMILMGIVAGIALSLLGLQILISGGGNG